MLLKPDDAKSSRDAMAKAVYAKLFGWVVAQINTALIDPSVKTADHGYLDPRHLRFRELREELLEQLFINFANEQLTSTVSLFKTEQEIYARGHPGARRRVGRQLECLEVIAGKGRSSSTRSPSTRGCPSRTTSR